MVTKVDIIKINIGENSFLTFLSSIKFASF